MQVEIFRSGQLEAVHQVSAVIVDETGAVLARFGREDPVYSRSAVKPFQAAVAMDTDPYPGGISGDVLAVACSSHRGRLEQIERVRELLSAVGHTERDLRTPRAWPRDLHARIALALGGTTNPARLWHQCSGNHAVVLAGARTFDHDEVYTSPDHPINRDVLERLPTWTSEAVAHSGIDNCGLPCYAMTLVGLARGYLRLASSHPAIVAAMREHPSLVSGRGRTDAVFSEITGAAAKAGAEGVLAAVLPGGPGVALKAWDGSERAVAAAASFLGRELGFETETLMPEVLGGGEVVGEVRVRT